MKLVSNQPPSMDILRILAELEHQVLEAPRRFAGLTLGLDRDEISTLLLKIRASLPTELKAAASTLRESERIVEGAREDATMTLESAQKERERILAEARAEAERIVGESRLQQERMTAESEILKLAKAQSEEIRSTADRDSVKMRRGAEEYAFDTLGKLEEVIGRVRTAVERGKQEMSKETPTSAVVREKARV